MKFQATNQNEHWPWFHLSLQGNFPHHNNILWFQAINQNEHWPWSYLSLRGNSLHQNKLPFGTVISKNLYYPITCNLSSNTFYNVMDWLLLEKKISKKHELDWIFALKVDVWYPSSYVKRNCICNTRLRYKINTISIFCLRDIQIDT